MTNLEVAVLVYISARKAAHFRHGGDVNVRIRKEKEIDRTAGGDALLAEFRVEVRLRTENRLRNNNKTFQSFLQLLAAELLLKAHNLTIQKIIEILLHNQT